MRACSGPQFGISVKPSATCCCFRNHSRQSFLLHGRSRRTVVSATRRETTSQNDAQEHSSWQARLACGIMASLAAVQILAATPPPSQAKEAFLQSTGARGLLAEEEERLFKLRQEIEGEARQELDRARMELEEKGRTTQSGKLCATPFGVDIVGITELIALTGALVGGFSARQRKDEVERLNEQLRKINLSLRQQAKSGTIYAPGLNYAPPPTFKRSEGGTYAVIEPQQAQPTRKESTGRMLPSSSLMGTIDEDDLPAEQQQCLMSLREGKRLLKEKQGASAMVRFEKAQMMAKSLGERIYERRAIRGLAAAARLQNQPQRAIEHLKRVLEISKEVGDHRGDEDVNGTIADILTGLGDFTEAAKYYDQYIQGLQGSDA